LIDWVKQKDEIPAETASTMMAGGRKERGDGYITKSVVGGHNSK
jgi:hypothetical protein